MKYHARWVLPIVAPPLRHGSVVVEDGRIVAVETRRRAAPGDIDLESVAVLPGLVNAHTHLELSWMRGLVPPAESMPAWARQVITLRGTRADPVAPLVHAIDEARAAGTALVGDVTNSLASYDPLARSLLHGLVFRELIKFNPASADALVESAVADLTALPRAPQLRASLAVHAPYSVAPAVFAATRAALERWPERPTTVHLAESVEEVEFLRRGSGPWRTLLQDLGAWDPAWRPPQCGPAEYLQRLGFLGPRVLAVHGVHFDPEDLGRLRMTGTTVVTCPRSNAWTGAGTPPIDRFYARAGRVAIGTDSLASAPDLNMFAEMAAAWRVAPTVAPRRLLESATRIGAEALGFGAELGTIERGKRAALIAVRVPEDVQDVEEYLVSGIPPADIRWLADEHEF